MTSHVRDVTSFPTRFTFALALAPERSFALQPRKTESDWGPLLCTFCDPPTPALCSSGKNVRRSIQGVGHMMSTMVLNRKQSVFGGPSLPADAGAAEPLDRNKFEENEDVVVMETKLKILEILQVAGPGACGGCWGQARRAWVGWFFSGCSGWYGGRLHGGWQFSTVVLSVWPSDQQHQPLLGLRNSRSWAPPHTYRLQTPEAGPSLPRQGQALPVIRLHSPLCPGEERTGEVAFHGRTDFEAELGIRELFFWQGRCSLSSSGQPCPPCRPQLLGKGPVGT